MQVSSNNAGVSAPAYPEQASGSANRQPFLYSFAGLLDAMVIGSPDARQLNRTEAHFRELGSTEDGATALRSLRIATAQHGRYPALLFHPDLPLAVPLLRYPASEISQAAGIMHSADEALRAAVADVCQIQINMMTQQTNALIARIVENMDRQLFPSSVDAQAAPSAVRPVPYQSTPGLVQQPLATIVRYWLGLQHGELESRWDEIEQQSRIHGESQEGPAFKNFLMGLAHTHVFQCPVRRAEVSLWLAQAAQPGRATLRDAAFEICVESSTMCPTRMPFWPAWG